MLLMPLEPPMGKPTESGRTNGSTPGAYPKSKNAFEPQILLHDPQFSSITPYTRKWWR